MLSPSRRRVCLNLSSKSKESTCLSLPRTERKRALPQQAFGSLLSSLISAPAPTKPLRPLHPPPAAEALERKARKQLLANKHEREERGHISDVIAGWSARPNIPFSQWSRLETEDAPQTVEYGQGGAEREKELRRLAQRGAVRLFNAIKAAQTTEADVLAGGSGRVAAIKADTGASRRAIKQASPAASVASTAAGSTAPAGGPVGRQANMLGSRGKQEARKSLIGITLLLRPADTLSIVANLSKASFLELFKTGTAAKPKVAI